LCDAVCIASVEGYAPKYIVNTTVRHVSIATFVKTVMFGYVFKAQRKPVFKLTG